MKVYGYKKNWFIVLLIVMPILGLLSMINESFVPDGLSLPLFFGILITVYIYKNIKNKKVVFTKDFVCFINSDGDRTFLAFEDIADVEIVKNRKIGTDTYGGRAESLEVYFVVLMNSEKIFEFDMGGFTDKIINNIKTGFEAKGYNLSQTLHNKVFEVETNTKYVSPSIHKYIEDVNEFSYKQ